MPATRIHLVRHGEVHNPEGVLYGRLPHYALSDLGHQMADLAAQELLNAGRPVSAIICSPLLRTQESAEHIRAAFGGVLALQIEERIIEPYNIFEGKKLSLGRVLIRPHLWFHLRNPGRPSWGEPFASVSARMISAMDSALLDHTARATAGSAAAAGDIVMVSHQMPIWITHLTAGKEALAHDPRKRRCALSSITSFERRDGAWVEVEYRDPAASLRINAIDVGAV